MGDFNEEIPDGPLLIEDEHAPVPTVRPMDSKTQPKKKTKGPIPDRQSNGFYANHQTGERLRSVTTILSGGVPKPSLVFWAGNMVADSAIENLPQLVAASMDPARLAEMRSWLTRAHTRKRDERAEVGGAVHKIIECRILETELPSSVVVGDVEWAFDGPELEPFVSNFLAFEEQWKPRWTASEMVVANSTHNYAGTLDYTIAGDGLIGDALRESGYVVEDDEDIMGDTKTGGDWIVPADGSEPHPKILGSGHVHGVYPEAGLQESAYRHAETAWLPDGTQVPMPKTASVGIVLHLRPEGFRIFPARCGDREYQYFRHAQMVDEWSSRISSAKVDEPVIGSALVLPKPRRRQAVA